MSWWLHVAVIYPLAGLGALMLLWLGSAYLVVASGHDEHTTPEEWRAGT